MYYSKISFQKLLSPLTQIVVNKKLVPYEKLYEYSQQTLSSFTMNEFASHAVILHQ